MAPAAAGIKKCRHQIREDKAHTTHTTTIVRTLSSSATSKGWSLLRRLIRACSMLMNGK
jgi:hypothetical protein